MAGAHLQILCCSPVVVRKFDLHLSQCQNTQLKKKEFHLVSAYVCIHISLCSTWSILELNGDAVKMNNRCCSSSVWNLLTEYLRYHLNIDANCLKHVKLKVINGTLNDHTKKSSNITSDNREL